MGERLKIILPILNFIQLLVASSGEGSYCQFNDYNFERLDKFAWNVVVLNDSTRIEYQISLCRPLNSSLTGCQQNTSVCRIIGLEGTPVGIYQSSFASVMTEDANRRELTLTLQSHEDCHDGSSASKMKTFIIFKCGKTLGMPVFVDSYACSTYFEWHTTAACSSPANVTETKCYVYDSVGLMRDLNPLIKTTGSYRVEMDEEDGGGEIYINVCHDIMLSSGCQNSASCLFRNSSAISLGTIESDSRLQFDSDGSLFIIYTSSKSQPGCNSFPSTKVTFRCPQQGMGKMPQLISSDECQYHVEWQTEFACPTVDLVSKTCQLNQPQRNIDIDIRSLATGRDTAFSIEARDSAGKKYTYSLNVCSSSAMERGVLCGDNRAVAACQFSDGNPKSLGQLEKQTLRYSDDQLSLTYEGGDPCSSGFQRKTIINFHCNKSAGNGVPEFSGEDSCTYIFDWGTELACIAPPLQCQLSANGANYNLFRLIRSKGMDNWHVTDAESSETIILNVCRNLSETDDLSVNCPAGAAICLIKSKAVAVSLGKFKSSPIFDQDTRSILLAYTGGDVCDHGRSSGIKYSANITFKCSPGGDDSEPRIFQKTSGGCHYELVWFTAFACSLAHKTGENCRVDDPSAGYSFDLNPLSKPFNLPNSYYKVTSESVGHDYFVNVCGPVTGTACSDQNVGVCQVEKSPHGQVHSTGQANRTLHYYDGILKLVYENGDAYHTDPPIARKTEIEFLCDTEAQIGWPRFVVEANHTYNIEWLTSYACPPMFIDCSVVDLKNKKRYDLSHLSRKGSDGNWPLDVTLEKIGRRKFYINVCRPVISLDLLDSDPCDASAGICLTEFSGGQEKVLAANLGRSLQGPKITSDGNILLEYTNGGICIWNNETKHYAVNVTFVCSKEPSTNGPSRVTTDDGCTYSMMWETAFACPEEATVETGGTLCSIKDPVTGLVYNMRPLLSDKAYVVNSTGRTFKLNICGFAAECGGNGVAVCDDKGEPLGYSSNSTIQLTNDLVELTYYGPDTASGKRDVRLVFTCNRRLDQNSPRITFIKEEAAVFLFNVESPLACLSHAIDCQAFDVNGDKYDLSPLTKLEDNWFVEDPKQNKYYINVCRPINPINSTRCPGGATGGCQVTATGDIFNMGYVQRQVIASEPNTLTIQYENGDICHKGTAKESHRSTRIIFYCSSRHESPVFVREEDDCEYVIEWRTPFACPVQRVIGDDCKVEEPLYHVTFDLSELTKTGDEDYVVYSGGQRNFSLNICGSLRTHLSDNCAGDTGSCVAQGSTFTSIGNYTRRLEYADGELKLVYVDGKENCNGKHNRTTTVVFSCDHSKHGASGLSYIETKSSECSHWFSWQTSLACLPFSEAECSIVDDSGNMFNFEPLMLSKDNYEVSGSDAPGGSAKFVINVCTTLVHTKGALCPPNSAACMIRLNESDPKKRYTSIGQLGKNVLSFEDGHLVLMYSGGGNCSDGQMSRTVIQLDCSMDAVDSKPEYVTTESGCIHRFVWSTRYACVFNSSHTPSGDCSVRDPLSGYLYNLSALRSEAIPYTVSDAKFDHVYNLSVCQPLINSSCGPDSGSCQTEKQSQLRSFNAGQSNAFVTFVSKGLLSLTYSNGTMCHHNSKPRSTTINFICASGAGKGRPAFVGEDTDECSYIFSWHTDLACDHEVHCVAHAEDEDFDLSSLKMETGFYLTTGTTSGASSGSYYINVCRPLGAIYGKFCPPGAAVCREDLTGKFVSLGSPDADPVYDSVTKSVVLVYSNGSHCPNNSGLLWKTRITFTCKNGQSEELPKLISVDEDLCEYRFEWNTSAVCPTTAPDVLPSPGSESSCIFTDSKKNQYDLSSLKSSSGSLQIPSRRFPGSKYNISLCGEFKTGICKLSAVCRVNGSGQVSSYGSARSLLTIFELPTVKLSYQNGSACSTGSSKAHFMMECDRSSSKESKPMLAYEEECSVIIRWPTPFACPPKVRQCIFQYFGRSVDLSPFILKTGSWKMNDSNGNSYFLNLCHGINDGPDGCGNDKTVCRKRSNGALELLGEVDSQSYSTFSHGSEQALVIEYSYQSQKVSCGTRILMTCSADNEGPRFKEAASECIVEIEWKTSLVCQGSSGVIKSFSTPTAPTTLKDQAGSMSRDDTLDKSQGTSRTHSGAVVITVCVLISILLITLLLVVFRNPSRRAAFIGRVKSCHTWSTNCRHPSMKYSALSDRDQSEEDGLLNRGNGNIQRYDSDDDILL